MTDVAANYRTILARVGEAAAKRSRKAEKIKLLGAAKSQSIAAIRAAIDAGVKLIGENYVQEAEAKVGQISQAVEWHMIGHLQRNKAKAAVEIFDVIESLDNLALARELDKEGRKRDKVVRVLIEVNLGGERNKSGIAANNVAGLLEESARLAHLRIEGVMTVPPFPGNGEKRRSY